MSVGLLPVRSPLPRRGRPFDPIWRRLLDDRVLSIVDGDGPLQARLFLAWHVAPLLGLLDRPLQVQAAHAVLRFDQLPWQDEGPDHVRIARIRTNFVGMLRGGPFEEVGADTHIAETLGPAVETWLPPVAPVPASGHRNGGAGVTIGRHGGVGAVVWPADPAAFGRAYPAGPALQVDLLGAPVGLVRDRIARASPHLRLLPDHGEPVPDFLQRLDAWHMAGWRGHHQPVTAEIVEAAASGLPLSLPREVSGWPEDAAAFHGGEFRDLQPDRQARSARAREYVRLEADPARQADRLVGRGLRVASPISLRLAADPQSRRRILMVSPNGVGMGHLTRLLAVARRLPGSVDPIFLTMSQAVEVVERYGFHAEYLPYHAYYGGDPDYWNRGLLARMQTMVGFYDPRLILFDGNMPYAALADLRRLCPERRFLWLRRGLWRPDAGKVAIERSHLFDMIIEPGEFAGEADRGLTRTRAGELVRVPPVTLLEPDEILTRAEARAELGIPLDATAIVILLGSQNNFDYGPVRRTLAARYGQRPHVVMVEAEWLISDTKNSVLLPGARMLSGFPLARLFRAFDVAISAAGYNSFHELLGIGIPTIFVPNENPSMDEQEARAAWAERRGLGVAVRAHDTDRLNWALDAILAPGVAERMRRNAAALPAADGGSEIARLIMEQVVSRDVVGPAPALPHLAPHSAPLLG